MVHVGPGIQNLEIILVMNIKPKGTFKVIEASSFILQVKENWVPEKLNDFVHFVVVSRRTGLQTQVLWLQI